MTKRERHNLANQKWRLNNPNYFRIWKLHHKDYIPPCHAKPEYQSWCHMKSRCYNANTENFRWYGAKGIKVCDRWFGSFENFYRDMGKRPKGTSLDRIDNTKDYEPSNCKWSTPKQQCKNRSGLFALRRRGR